MPDQLPDSHEPDPTSDWTRTSASGAVPAEGGFGPYRFLQRLGEGGMDGARACG